VEEVRMWTGGVALVVQRLLCKYKLLSSNPSPTKKVRMTINKSKKQIKTIIGIFFVLDLFVNFILSENYNTKSVRAII
jgi:hypothetical protein